MQPRSNTQTSRLFVGAAIALSLVAASCGGSESSDAVDEPEQDLTEVSDPDDAEVITDETEEDDADVEPDVAETTSTTTTSTTTTTTVPSRGADPSDPAPVGDPVFDQVGIEFNGDVIGTSMLGLVSLPVEPDETGTCVAILHVVTVEASEGLVSSAQASGSASLYIGEDEEVFASFGDCDDSALETAGYIVNGTEALPGTQYGVMTPFLLEDGVSPVAMSLGSFGEERFYDVTPLAEIPALDDLTVGVAPTDLVPSSADAADAQRFGGGILDDVSTFDVSSFGFLAVDRREGSDATGRCVTTVGSLKGVEAPGAIINSFGIPEVQVLAGGRLWNRSDAIGDCDEDTLEASGYFTEFGAGVAPGNTFAVQTPILIPEGLEPEAIVVGDADSVDGYVAFEAVLLAAAPAAPEREMINPDVDSVAVGEPSSFSIEVFDSTWNGTISGLLALSSNAVDEFTCYAVLGEMARNGEDNFVPDVGIIAGGGYFGDGVSIGVNCDESALDAAGYVHVRDMRDLETVTESTRFYTTIFVQSDAVLGAIAVGNAASDDNVLHVEPTIIDAIPA